MNNHGIRDEPPNKMMNRPRGRKGWLQKKENRNDLRILVISLCLAAVFGAIWVGLIAAWEHHDEPNHLQYIRMLLDLGRKPQPGDEDFKLNRQILKSMIWNGFFERLGSEPTLPPPRQPTYLPGYSQYSEPPLYYYLASVGVAALRSDNITRQMYGARVISWVLYILSIFAAWGLTREITTPGNPLRWMVPITMTFLPGFVDIMTAVNNDAGAVAVMSFFLWASVRLIKRGFSWFEFLWALSLAAIGLFMKSTAMVAILLLPFTLLFSVLRGRWQWLVWIGCGLGLLAGFFFLFDAQDAAFFYRSSSMEDPIRSKNPQAILGDWVLQINQNLQSTPPWMPPVFHPIPLETTTHSLGQTVTLGVWMWSNNEITSNTPVLMTETSAYVNLVQLKTYPIFYTVKAQLNDSIPRLWISFDQSKPVPENTVIFYDGMVLAKGDRPLDELPEFDDVNANSGTWGTSTFQNMIRNGSLEIPGLRVIPSIDQMATKFIPDQIRPSFVLSSILDSAGAGYYYSLAAQRIFYTFWGYFGWAHIPMSASWLYSLAWIATVIAFIGVIITIIRSWRDLPWNIIFIFGLATVIIFLAALIRGVIYLSFQNMFFPVARYMMPVVIPVLLFFCRGWLEVSRLIQQFIDRIRKKQTLREPGEVSWISVGLYIAGWVIIAIMAIYSVLQYYGGYPLFF